MICQRWTPNFLMTGFQKMFLKMNPSNPPSQKIKMTNPDEIKIREVPDASPKWKRVVASGHGKEMRFEIPMDEWNGLVPRDKIHASVSRVFCKAMAENAPVLRMATESLPNE